MSEYKIKKTDDLVKKIVPFWNKQSKLLDEFYKRLAKIEKEMELATGIKDIEFFMPEGIPIGVGNLERDMELIHDTELEGNDGQERKTKKEERT